jgi:O-antigen/teichoic acid export membrane protein
MIFFTLIIARRLGQEGLGAFAFMTSVVFIGNILSTFGTDMLIVREISGRQELSQIAPALYLQLLISLGLILLLNLSSDAFPNLPLETDRGLRVISLALLPMSLYSVASATLRGFERMRTLMYLNLALVALQTGLAWTLISTGDSIVELAWLLLLTHVIVAVLASAECLKIIPDVRKAKLAQGLSVGVLLVASAPIALISILKVAYQRSGVLMLTALAGPAAAGLFSAALRLVEAAQFVHIAIMGALFPVMAQVHGEIFEGTRDTNQVLQTSWRIMIGLGLLAAGLLFTLSGLLVPLLYGSQFSPAIPALRLLSWSLIPFSVNIYLSSQLLAARKERTLVLVYLTSLALLAGLNAWMIPNLGLMGACLTLLISEAFQAAVFLLLARSLTLKTRSDRLKAWIARGRR